VSSSSPEKPETLLLCSSSRRFSYQKGQDHPITSSRSALFLFPSLSGRTKRSVHRSLWAMRLCTSQVSRPPATQQHPDPRSTCWVRLMSRTKNVHEQPGSCSAGPCKSLTTASTGRGVSGSKATFRAFQREGYINAIENLDDGQWYPAKRQQRQPALYRP